MDGDGYTVKEEDIEATGRRYRVQILGCRIPRTLRNTKKYRENIVRDKRTKRKTRKIMGEYK